MLPFMAQGHVIPFLALAHHLESTKNYTIAFVNTHLNIKKIKSSLPQSSPIHFLETPFNIIDHDLPPCTENTDSHPFDVVRKLLEATLSFKPHFKKLIIDLIDEQNGHKPLCIITDMFFGWCKEIAQEYGIFHAIFIEGGGFGFACYYSLWVDLPHRNTDSDEFLLLDFPEASTIHVNQLASNFAYQPVLRFTGSKAGAGKEHGISAELCKNWLDRKPCRSVLYVSFGSQDTIAVSQMVQLAMALEASGKNFIWIVRPPIGFDINSEFRANDADGTQSALEALSHGVPINGWPLAAEQFYNSNLLGEEVGVCAEVARGMNCAVLKEHIVVKIELVMNETEKGKPMRMKDLEVKEIIDNAFRNDENLRDLL
ncbi:UDP-glycosyltransferase 92A1 [Citrus sinensis]|uniref:UDP-glycosyltransferase 92A1 n=1 Tax=Citrus sinensis TaxID=2711 RepID=A0ACB8MVD3_CITSI|nr:UDP-glycosyltransferase 92A1 [Citrus sinensis]KAH9789562.1 UDP-glycosyltransferase 92A1 [Citrus sinensis]